MSEAPKTVQHQFVKKFSNLLSSSDNQVLRNPYWQFTQGFDDPTPTGGNCHTVDLIGEEPVTQKKRSTQKKRKANRGTSSKGKRIKVVKTGGKTNKRKQKTGGKTAKNKAGQKTKKKAKAGVKKPKSKISRAKAIAKILKLL